MTDWDKTDIIHFLSDLYGYRSYLEIATPTTGTLFGKIDRSKFATCDRLMYRCRDDYDDQLNIDFRARDLDIGKPVAAMSARKLRYDIILVDPFHRYDTSYRDLAAAVGLLAEGGAIVVHDCLPTDESLVSDDFIPGAWCGLTFMAYVNFVHGHPAIDHVTVDTDYGCGIIRKRRTKRPVLDPGLRDVLTGWRMMAGDAKAAYRFLAGNKQCLLNLQSVEDFRRLEAQRWGTVVDVIRQDSPFAN